MDEKVIDKLNKLREYYYNDDFSLKWIAETEANIRRLVVQDELKEKESVIAIVKEATDRVNTINKILVYKEDLTEEQRALLYRERVVHQFYLDRFEGRDIDKRFERIESLLDEELKRIGADTPEK